MFDKLIESETAPAMRQRRKYFAMSAVVVGILFLTAVVINLYSQAIDLGTDEFDVALLAAPVESSEPEPEPQPEPAAANASASDRTSRQANIARIDEGIVTDVPQVSVIKNTQRARPVGGFDIGPGFESDKSGSQGTAPGPGGSGTKGGSGSLPAAQPATNIDKDADTTPPPPARKAPEPPRSIGVVNGIAKRLPKPRYPQPAIAVGAGGDVSVQVLIDEDGRVVSARAVSGHPMLRQVSEAAAREAIFTPTLLSNKPIKVTGVIIYRFTRN